MMVQCKKCGGSNPLGRVFCLQCGVKLDLDDMGSETVRKMVKVSWYRKYWRTAATAVLAVVAILVALAAWPKTDLTGTGKLGSKPMADNLAVRMGEIDGNWQKLQRNDRFEVQFPEKNINAYLQYATLKDMNDVAVRVAVDNGYFTVRAIRRLAHWEIGPVRLAPSISYDLVCVPNGDNIYVAKAWIGHLRAWGPLKTSVVRKVYGLVAHDKAWKCFAHVAEIKATNEVLSVTVRK